MTDQRRQQIRRAVVEALADLLAKHAGEWIAVGERLPEINDAVLIFIPMVGGTRIAWRMTSGWASDDESYTSKAVTHWRPLPPGPGKDGR